MKILMGRRFEMDVSVGFYVFCFYVACLFLQITGQKHLKTWKPNNNILSKENWIDPDSKENCGKVEFGEVNTAPIYIDKLTAKEFVLPYSGELRILDGGYLSVVDQNSNEKTNCLKLKELRIHDYLDPSNWDSDVANNPAVPDREKLPCRDDIIELPNDLYSGMDIGNAFDHHYVSSVSVNRSRTNNIFPIGYYSRIVATNGKCRDPSGCICNEEELSHCPPLRKPDCLNPVYPSGFCHMICGAYMTFKSTPGFILKNIEDSLKEYSDIFTHVSKVDDDVIQVVFAEEEYSGDSVVYAQDFFRKLQKESSKFRIKDLKALEVSGVQISGNASFATVFFTSLLFVLGLFAFIFCVYGDRRWFSHFRFRSPSSFPLTSTYRARFTSREDESGLIFDTQSIAGSVLNLRQSFDNPMFGEESKVGDKTDTGKIETSEVNPPEEKSMEKSKNDPLFDLKKLNEELHEEIGSDIVEDIQNSVIPPLIEVEEMKD